MTARALFLTPVSGEEERPGRVLPVVAGEAQAASRTLSRPAHLLLSVLLSVLAFCLIAGQSGRYYMLEGRGCHSCQFLL